MSKTYTPDDFARWLMDHLATSNDTNTVDLIPAPCGVGKSYSMTVQISEALRNHNGGIILVTDEIDRMHNYVDMDTSSYLGDYIKRNRDRILVYEAANAKADRGKLYTTPIIIMSTQRFFNLNRQAVIELTDTYIPRRNIFIDERAPISEIIKVDIGVFNDIDTALNTQLDNTATEKEWLIQQWRNLRARYDNYMSIYEHSHNDYELHLWHVDTDTHATTDDEKFRHLTLETYAAKLRRADNEICKRLKAVLQIVTKGALFISRRKPNSKSKTEYSNFFLVTLDHSDLLLHIGSKSVILDGTGNLDPIYKAWYVNQVDCTRFNRNLQNLTINIVDANTSRNAIAKSPDSNPKLKAIVEYVQTLPKVDAVFTYGYGKSGEIHDTKTVEREFYRAGYLTGHFGGLKGTNKYRDFTDIVQVGLHCIPPEYYLAMAIDNVVSKYPPDINHLSLTNLTHAAKHIMMLSVLADIEQNLFRGAIRNVNSEKHMTYTIIFRAKPQLDKDGIDHNELSDLTEMIKERYEGMGAIVNVLDTPNTVLELKTRDRKTKDGNKTIPQKVLDYLNAVPEGTVFTGSDIIKWCQISKDQFDNAKKNKSVKAWLKDRRRDNRHYVA